MTPEVCTRIDFDEISKCDFLIAYPGVPASPGTHIELGWASAQGKPIVLLLEEGREYAFLVQGLGVLTPIETVVFGEGGPDVQEIAAAIQKLSERRHGEVGIF